MTQGPGLLALDVPQDRRRRVVILKGKRVGLVVRDALPSPDPSASIRISISVNASPLWLPDLGVVDRGLILTVVFCVRSVRGLDYVGPCVLAFQIHRIVSRVGAR